MHNILLLINSLLVHSRIGLLFNKIMSKLVLRYFTDEILSSERLFWRACKPSH